MIKHTLIAAAFAVGTFAVLPAVAAEGERKRITGEVIDTWCYFSGVMGGPDAVVGSAHHTCALWCAAGGIPVGMLAEDGTVYIIVKWQGEPAVANDTLLSVQSHEITADGIVHTRDGINYIIVEEVVADAGITNVNHEDYFVVPPFAIPDPAQ